MVFVFWGFCFVCFCVFGFFFFFNLCTIYSKQNKPPSLLGPFSDPHVASVSNNNTDSTKRTPKDKVIAVDIFSCNSLAKPSFFCSALSPGFVSVLCVVGYVCLFFSFSKCTALTQVSMGFSTFCLSPPCGRFRTNRA